MNKFKKRIISLALGLIAMSSVATPTLAANTKDASLPTDFISFGSSTTTNVRSKTNTTPVYMNNQSGMTLWVYANGGYKPSNVSLTYSTGTTIGRFARVPVGKYVIHTYIYENGYRSAWLNISTATSGVSGKCRGKWSPDTAGSYPSAN